MFPIFCEVSCPAHLSNIQFRDFPLTPNETLIHTHVARVDADHAVTAACTVHAEWRSWRRVTWPGVAHRHGTWEAMKIQATPSGSKGATLWGFWWKRGGVRVDRDKAQRWTNSHRIPLLCATSCCRTCKQVSRTQHLPSSHKVVRTTLALAWLHLYNCTINFFSGLCVRVWNRQENHKRSKCCCNDFRAVIQQERFPSPYHRLFFGSEGHESRLHRCQRCVTKFSLKLY